MSSERHRRLDVAKDWSRTAGGDYPNAPVDYCGFGLANRRKLAKMFRGDKLLLIQHGRAWLAKDHGTGFYVYTLGVPRVEDSWNGEGRWPPPPRDNKPGG